MMGNTDKYEMLKLESQLCFPLYVVSKEIVRKYKPFLNEVDLTYTQYITMMVLWEENEILVKHLGEKLFLDSGTLTPVLNGLEKKGYAARRRSETDKRDVYVVITEKGRSLRDKAVEIPSKMGECVPIDQEKAMVLYQILHEMMEKF
ncbi:MAG: MarR family transcriptional regulator [Frisingicoccus sp.]|uniref:MarR family winged helix-turn-helix transcriptional regulator n=1 Tax=Frisingicoccus sp. TaxID=1918627 RepID=UPI002A82CC2D|nr:MarR family transcriptional regulator [Frisingicoccus sp.]MDY4836102.1 MarR family transcriptional regulator [Frisingicoccus sp.]MDY5955533.1 MarR family transcriptional regulator [Frisingicoccus sp.]